MRIRLLRQFGLDRAGTILDVNYTRGSNLIFTGHAEEVKDDAPADKAIEEAPKDKMIRKQRTRRKTTQKGRPDGIGKDQNA